MSAATSNRVRKTPLFNKDSQNVYELKQHKLTWDNLDKEFGKDKTPTPNRNKPMMAVHPMNG